MEQVTPLLNSTQYTVLFGDVPAPAVYTENGLSVTIPATTVPGDTVVTIEHNSVVYAVSQMNFFYYGIHFNPIFLKFQ
jgi:hypothetical protein